MIRILSFICSLLLCSMAFAAQPFSPVGKWKTIDDVTHKPRSIVEITEDQSGLLQGKMIKGFYRPGEGPADVCKKCTGERHNQTILGMTILWGYKDKHNVWQGGHILDPENGKIYRSRMILSADGQKLDVRGYIGIPLFGRSQTWLRVNDADVSAKA